MQKGSAAFPGFLHALGRAQDPQAALTAALSGPLHPGEPQAGFIAQMVGDTLHLVAAAGMPQEFVDRYRTVPTVHDGPLTAALHHLDLVTIALPDVTETYPTVALDAELWAALTEQFGSGATLVVLPIWSAERIAGVLGFVTAAPVVLDDASVLHGVAAALGLWFGARDLGAQPAVYPSTGEIPLVLTARQREILVLVEQGKSNPVIAATLGFSVATVKAELARLMRMLRASDRKAAAATARRLGFLGESR